MVETASHQAPPPQVARPPPPPLGGSRGPIFPPNEQLHQLHYCIHSNPPWPQAIILAFQHYIVMLGSTVLIASTLVPLMDVAFYGRSEYTASNITRARLPTVMGASFAFFIPVMSIVNDFADKTFKSEHERFVYTMRAIQGSLMVSSIINIFLGYSRVWGNLTRFFSPVILVPVVCVVGLGLFMRGFPQLANCVEIGLPMLILLVIGQQYLKRIHPRVQLILERFGLLLCVAIIWAFAGILTVAGAYKNAMEQTKRSCRVDHSYLISSSPWIRIPYPFQWGPPVFRASHVFGMMGAALVTSAESTGTFFAAARLAGATPPPPHVLSRSIGLQGISLLLDGLFGTVVGTTASVHLACSDFRVSNSLLPNLVRQITAPFENVGLLGLTHIGSRRVVQISTAFMFFFSIFGKFGAFFASIPLPIFAAIYCVLFGIVAATGISFLQFANSNSMRNLYVLGLSLFLGVSISQYFVSHTTTDGHGPVKTDGGWFNDILNTIFSSPPTVAIIVGRYLITHLIQDASMMTEEFNGWFHSITGRAIQGMRSFTTSLSG
ncbi:Nucleobase-ascorbate transporter 3 [Vitis vinifera]|uniref:Nucleobase-ascorbate transporter 3 n=1 Tax=Vitis vinifera TaxID=29760 RepID=A0A438ES76_VITVI|nr:Nucleobase-ascorbate transporter 3 [Vitis vinifera]